MVAKKTARKPRFTRGNFEKLLREREELDSQIRDLKFGESLTVVEVNQLRLQLQATQEDRKLVVAELQREMRRVLAESKQEIAQRDRDLASANAMIEKFSGRIIALTQLQEDSHRALINLNADHSYLTSVAAEAADLLAGASKG